MEKMNEMTEEEKMLMEMVKSGKISMETLKKVNKECNKKIPEIKYMEHTEKEDKNNVKYYSVNNKEDYKKLLKNDEYVEYLFKYYNVININSKHLLEIKSDKKKRKPDDMEDDEDGNRCNAMVWGGGDGGRCKSKICNEENGLCKLHNDGIKNKKRLLAYGHYKITGKNSVPDPDGKKFIRNNEDDISYEDEDDILLLKPINKVLLDLHYNILNKKEYFNSINGFNEYIKELDLSDRERKIMSKFYDEKDYLLKPVDEPVEENDEEEIYYEDEDENEPVESITDLMLEIVNNDKLKKSYEVKLTALKDKKRKSKKDKKEIEDLDDNISELEEKNDTLRGLIKKIEDENDHTD
jgi:hypothetical protein